MSDKLVFSAIRADLIPMVWPNVSEKIGKAIEHSNGEFDEETVLKRLMDQQAVLINVSDSGKIIASFIVEQREFDTGKKILLISLAGGEQMSEWRHEMNEIFDKLARDYDCSEIYIVGRAGWERSLRDLNYRKLHTIVCRTVGE